MAIRIALLLLFTACAAPDPIPTTGVGPGSKAFPTAPTAKKAPGKGAPKKAAPPKDETLGQCLARKGVHLYGASWCHPCHDQLAWFGDDAKNVPYTDCQPSGLANLPACDALGIEIFPTWVFPDGLQVRGTRSLEWLATSTDCPLRIK
jgi:hypothetical protein